MSIADASNEEILLAVPAQSGASVTLPDGFSFARSEFFASGPDLVVAAPDGERLVVRGFFDAAPPPDLVNAGGGQIAGQMVARLAQPAEAEETAQIAPIAAAGHVGNVAETLTAIRADGSEVTLHAGDPVFAGDTVVTGDGGGASVVLADQSIVSMAAGSRTVLDEVIYDPASETGSITLTVAAGSAVIACGKVARHDPDAMTVKSPMAEIAVRDAQLGVTVPPVGPERVVLMEQADGFVGELSVGTAGGAEILNLPNQATYVVAPEAAPTAPEIFVLDEIIEAYHSALAVMPVGIGLGNDFGVGPSGLGEEPAVEVSSDDAEAAGEAEFETAAGGDPDGGVPDFIQVTDGGAPLSAIDPVRTAAGEYSVAAASGPAAAAGDDNSDPPPPPPSGPNVIQGGTGPNSLTGSADADSIDGGAGDDTIDGRGGGDTIVGGAGDDLLRGGLGDDRIFGGTGDDVIVFAPGDGNDTVFDFGIGDQLDFEGALAGDVDIEISGDDLIITVKDGAGAEVNQVTVKDGAGYSVTETQTDDGVVIAVDPI
jgi:Ca2+-binding RTX toxin-like protein